MALTESDIKIIIAAELKKQGFKDAEKATASLTKNFKKLGAAVGVALSARAFINFSKAGAVAFAAEEKAVKQLTTSLSNLGFAYNIPAIEQFLTASENATMISKDELRPAIVSLISTTMDAEKSMKLLSLALDIVSATGADVGTVTSALSRAYNGNYSALAKLSKGYTAAELKALGFNETIAVLGGQFTGSAAAASDSYSFKIAKLQKAFDDTQKAVGEGLLKSIEQLGSGDYDRGLQELVNYGEAIGKAFGYAAGAVNTVKEAFDLITLRPVRDFTEQLLGKNQAAMTGGQTSKTQFELAKEAVQKRKDLALQKKILAERAKAERLESAARKKRAAELAKEAALKRAGTIFDMENIQVVAALQGRLTEEQRLRLTALLAIQTENATAAEKLSQAIIAMQAPAFANLGVIVKSGDTAETVIQRLLKAQAEIFKINLGLTNLPMAKNPFDGWLDVMAAIIKDIDKIKKGLDGIKSPVLPNPVAVTPTPTTATQVPENTGIVYTPSGNPMIVPKNTPASVFDDPRMYNEEFSNVLANPQLNWQKVGDTYVTNVTVQGSVTSSQDLVDMITDEIYKAQKSGKGILVNSVAL